MGVAGSGKTEIGEWLAARLGARFVEADGLHPEANIAKMSAGRALTDTDRRPWLERIRDAIAADLPVVATCSALKRSYRAVLRESGPVRFVFLAVARETAEARASARQDHFMAAGMVASQFEALEHPGDDEPDVIVIDADGSQERVRAAVAAAFGLG